MNVERALRYGLGVVAAALSAPLLHRAVQDQYWLRHNRIWDKGWNDAWECAVGHMRAYEDTPEKYVAEHGHWWRDDKESS
jgi:hypothetical protein